MTKREIQYINWRKFWHKRKPVKVDFKHEDGMDIYTALLTFGRIRVPDSMLKKMTFPDRNKIEVSHTEIYDSEKKIFIDSWDLYEQAKAREQFQTAFNRSHFKFRIAD